MSIRCLINFSSVSRNLVLNLLPNSNRIQKRQGKTIISNVLPRGQSAAAGASPAMLYEEYKKY